MAQNVTIAGASYSDVPAIDVPKTGGGTASFVDPSGTTATAPDVATGKFFLTAAGVLTEGTASGGGSSGGKSQTGTFTGSGAKTQQIQCDFEPDAIYVYGDNTGVTGIQYIVIVRDGAAVSRYRASATGSLTFAGQYNITGLNSEHSTAYAPYATYSNGVVTLNNQNNAARVYYNESVEYSYIFGKWTS